MVNAWSLAYEVLYGDLDKEYPIMNTDQKREQLKKMLEEDRMEETPWVYESPDGGKTVTRRKPGDDYTKKEVIQGDYYERDMKKPVPNLKDGSNQKYQEDKGIADLKSYVAST